PADGYSFWYSLFVQIGTIAYLFLALFFLKKLLQLYQVNDNHIALLLLTFTFGTNVFYYTISEPSMSHIYSFSFVSGFLFFVKRFFQSFNYKHALLASLFLGLVILVRPVNILIVTAIPFMAGSPDVFLKGLKYFLKNYFVAVTCAGIVVSIVSLQLIIYKIQTGSFFIYSYNEEGFNWLDPQISNFLFSYKKGLFVYMPVLFLTMVFGLGILTMKDRYLLLNFLLAFLLVTYVLSSWWNWYYGGSFGQRVVIEYYPLFALLAGITLNCAKKYVQKLLVSLYFLCIVVCQIQTYQYRYGIIHWEEMNKEKYWDVFLKIDL
ncbi:MAG TPA: hypothetical protein VII99_14795, partial [Bacteroidia bacterium]